MKKIDWLVILVALALLGVATEVLVIILEY